MEFTIEQKALHGALSKIAVALENKDELEAYTHVALRGSGNEVRLTASNRHMDTAARLSVEGMVDSSIGVSGGLLKKLVAALPDGPISFKLLKAHVSIQSGRSKMKLPVLSPQKFIETFPGHTDYNPVDLATEKISMHGFLKALDKVAHCINESHPRPEYVAVSVSDAWFVTTDGFRLAIWPNTVFKPDAPLLLHTAQVSRIRKVFAGMEEWGGIHLERDALLHLSSGGIACSTRLKAGNFPDFMRVLPGGPGDKIITVPKAETVEGLRRALLVCERGKQSVSVKPAGKAGLQFLVSSDFGEADEAVNCQGEFLPFIVNGKFLLDALLKLEKEEALFHLYYDEEEAARMIIIQEGDYRNVILPIRE